ncbi:MAG TPA: hypothetical protein VGI87_14090 [Solirubrobacteraceae bacterium]
MSKPFRIVQDLSVAALLGGNLFGRVALNPALGDVSDKSERGSVLNRAWQRYGYINSLALLTLVATHLSERLRGETGPGPRDVALGAVAITGLASAAGGVGFARQAPGGAVPLDSGSESAPETADRAAKLKSAVNILGALNLAAEFALLAIDA